MKYYIIFRAASSIQDASPCPYWIFLKRPGGGHLFSLTEAQVYLEKFDNMVLQHKILTEETDRNSSGGRYYVIAQSGEGDRSPFFCMTYDETRTLPYEQAVEVIDGRSNKSFEYKILKEV